MLIRLLLYILFLGLLSGCTRNEVELTWLRSVDIHYTSAEYEIDGMNTWVEIEVINRGEDTANLAEFIGNGYPMPSFILAKNGDSLTVQGSWPRHQKYLYVLPDGIDTFKRQTLWVGRRGHEPYPEFVIPEPIRNVDENPNRRFYINGELMVRKSLQDEPRLVPKSKKYHYEKIE